MSAALLAPGIRLHTADCLDVLIGAPDACVDAVVTDPPYEIGFMSKGWDASGIAYSVELWKQCLRVLKPGGHLVAFGGTRTYHRMTCAIEDAGFEIRDSLHWIYGSGFPKGQDVAKAIDKQRDDRAQVHAVSAYLRAHAARAGMAADELDTAFGFAGRMAGQWLTDRDWVLLPRWEQWLRLQELLGFGTEMDAEVWRLNGRKGTPGEAWQSAIVLVTEDRLNEASGLVRTGQGERTTVTRQIKAPATDEARQWEGWNTQLKPAHEPIILARKPLAGTVAHNVLEHGTGALNIDGCRVDNGTHIASAGGSRRSGGIMGDSSPLGGWESAQAGRWPPNILLTHDADCTDDGPCADGCPVAELDAQSGTRLSAGSGRGAGGQHGAFNPIGAQHGMALGYGDTGGASRFFPVFRYQAKAPRSERPRLDDGTAHPTVKPLALMRWLVRLVTPPGGVLLDPFAGSGTTLEAALLEGMRAIGVEREEPYAALCAQRLAQHTR